ncbi:MAG: ATP phosphoribosyltransferase [bacterium]|jgi:ATP phosphoribosyltransferase|nr:ATP phosphoribosyltransferase [bacterium]
MPILKVGLPSGSLQEATLTLFAKAGYQIYASPRSYSPTIDDPELEGLFLRAQEMAHYVQRGVLDVGLTGVDWIRENNADVFEVAELQYSKATSQAARWVIAVPEDSPIKSIRDLQGKRIATELVTATRAYLMGKGVEAEVEFSWGSTEAKVRVPGLVDAIAEITETGSSLRANKLRIIETMFETTPRLIANHASWQDPWKREKIQNIAMLLVGAFQAHDKVGLKMNVRKSDLSVIVGKLPALNNPTIANLLDENWVAIEVIVDERIVRDIIPQLKKLGAEGIIEYPLNKVIY